MDLVEEERKLIEDALYDIDEIAALEGASGAGLEIGGSSIAPWQKRLLDKYKTRMVKLLDDWHKLVEEE